MTKLNPYEQFCFDNAVMFTAIRGRTPAQRTRKELATFAEAKAAGNGDGRTMIYAVTAEDRFSHICNV